MIPVITERADELKNLCLRYGVERLDIFGSAATGHFGQEGSDLDFLVEFGASATNAYADSYFGLLDALTGLFGRPVDLVVESSISNPYFFESIKRTRTPVFDSIGAISYQVPLDDPARYTEDVGKAVGYDNSATD